MESTETLYTLYEKAQNRKDIQKKPAVIFHDGKTMHTMTYAELYMYSGLVSNELLSYSMTHEIICCLVGPGINLPALLLGILKVNSSFSILSSTDPIRCLSNILNYAPVQTILVEKKTAQLSKFFLCECWTIAKTFRVNLDHITLYQKIQNHCNDVEHVGGRAKSLPNSRRKLAYVIQTSGTTGNPKVVQVPHHCILPNIIYFRSLYGVNSSDRIFMASPLTFDPSIIDIFVSVSSGACLVLVPDHLKIMSQTLGEILINCQISILQITPSLLRTFSLDFLQKKLLRKCTKVRVLALGGELCPSYEVLQMLKDPDNSSTRIFNLYGITEVSCWAMCHEIDFWAAYGKKEVPLGKSILNTEVEVRNENGRSIYTGIGQLFVGSSERRCFINEHDWNSKDHLYPTGDWVYKKKSDIFFRGRKDAMIKYQGKKIDLVQIEHTLDKVPEVERHVVVFNQEKLTLSIFLCVASNEKKVESRVKHAVSEALKNSNPVIPPFKLIIIPHIPLNAHGKVDHRRLMNHETDLDKKRVLKKHTMHSITDAVSVLWKGFTKVDKVNNEGNFILSGGNSITALQLALEIESQFTFLCPALVDTLLNATFKNVIDLLAKQLVVDEAVGPPPKLRKITNIFEKVAALKTVRRSQNIENSLCHKDATRRGLTSFCVCAKCVNTHIVNVTSIEPVFRECFNYNLNKCIDASPCLVHFTHTDVVVCYIGSHSGFFTAINVKEEKVIWESCVPGRIESSACISECGQYVFVGSYDNCLYSFHSQTGKVHWKVKTGAEVKSSPVVSETRVFVGSHDHNLYAIDIQSGVVAWKKYLSNGSIYSSPAVSGNRVCAATLDGKIVMSKTEDGSEIWHYNYEAAFFSSPLVIMSYVFIAAVDGCLLKLDYTGNLIQKTNVGHPIFSSPAVIREYGDKGESLKIVIGSQNSGLHCFSFWGKLLWTFPSTLPINSTPFVISASNSSMYIAFANTKGIIYLLKAKDGCQVQAFVCPAEIFSSPVVINDYLAIGCRDNYVHIFKF